MIELANIKPYVEKMAHLISSVLEMDVTVCDQHLNVLGDWSHKRNVSDQVERLKEDSVISMAVRENRIVMFDNAKEENYGCQRCVRRKDCSTETIIAYPLVRGEQRIGGIGIYSQEQRQKNKMLTQKDAMIEFISRIGDLIINQLEEETANLEVMASNQKMNQIIETLDFPLVSVDRENRVLYCNDRFRDILPVGTDWNGASIEALFEGLVVGGMRERTGRIYIKKKHKSVEYEVTYSPVIIDGRYTGRCCTSAKRRRS